MRLGEIEEAIMALSIPYRNAFFGMADSMRNQLEGATPETLARKKGELDACVDSGQSLLNLTAKLYSIITMDRKESLIYPIVFDDEIPHHALNNKAKIPYRSSGVGYITNDAGKNPAKKERIGFR
jgi:hypothetical protein